MELSPGSCDALRTSLARQPSEASMAHAFDLVIRNGSVIDGAGGAPIEADVAVKDGRIAAAGKIVGSGAEEIDAKGKIVTPGFVDIHTHYDGQATWGAQLSPSSWHGVTTAVMGNCGFGIVPAPAAARDLVIRNLSVVEG
ncbi:MAG TPA: amidohydrolase family protein, partial [Hyphomonadaceae bacterium]|nr:amidohydrolase family protein [Hyphomonadaceae bacterium]